MPIAITRRDEGLLVQWDPAAEDQWIPARDLRLECPCAQCVEEMTGRALLNPASVPADVRPLAIALVGTYGLRVHWSDGHATGIYTFASLLRRRGGDSQ